MRVFCHLGQQGLVERGEQRSQNGGALGFRRYEEVETQFSDRPVVAPEGTSD